MVTKDTVSRPSVPLSARLATGPAPRARVSRGERWALFTFFCIAGLGIAYWLSFVIQYANTDALSRSYSALVATRSTDPHLGAIGVIWPPLPTLLQLPLVGVLPALGFYAFSGGIVSAVFAWITALALNEALARTGLRALLRWLLLALLFLNPFMLLYSGSGMSEMPFLCCFVCALYSYLRWTDDQANQWLAGSAFATALMFLTRYDAVPFALVFCGALLLPMLGQRRVVDPTPVEANLLAFLVPIVYLGMLWVFVNWQLFGDPLYFLRGEYSNAFLVRDVGEGADVMRIRGSPVAFALYLATVMLSLSPLFVLAVGVLAVVACVRRNAISCSLLALVLVIPLFQAISYRQAQTFGFWRFYISIIPAGLIVAAELVRALSGRRRRMLSAALLVLVLTGSNVWTVQAMLRDPLPLPSCGFLGTRDQLFIEALRRPDAQIDGCEDERQMASYIRDRFRERAILTDITGNVVVLFTGKPTLFVLLSDDDFSTIAHQRGGPAKGGTVEYVLTKRVTERELRALDSYFPALGTVAPPGLELTQEFGVL